MGEGVWLGQGGGLERPGTMLVEGGFGLVFALGPRVFGFDMGVLGFNMGRKA